MARSITMLSGLNTAELTLTKRGANNRRFAVTKGGIPMDPEVLQAIVSTPAEGEDQFLETLKSQGVTEDDKISAAVAQYRIQKGMKDLVDDATMATVNKAAGYTAKADDEDEDDKDKGKPDFLKPKKKKTAKSIDLSELSEGARAQVEAVFKSNADMADRSEKLEAVVKSMQDEKLEQHYVAKAASSYGNLPMADKDLGTILKSANDLSPEFSKGLETLLGRMDEMVAKSAMLTTMGAVRKQTEGGGWDKIQQLANGMVQKSVEGGKALTNSQAIDLVLKSETGAALYREYLGDNPKQRAEIY